MLQHHEVAMCTATFERFLHADNALVIDLPCLTTASAMAENGLGQPFRAHRHHR